MTRETVCLNSDISNSRQKKCTKFCRVVARFSALAVLLSLAAIVAVHNKKFGQMVVLKAGQIETADMSITANQTRTIELKLFADVAATFLAKCSVRGSELTVASIAKTGHDKSVFVEVTVN